MLTLEKDSPEFETNANQTGVQQFLLVKKGTTPDGKNVYIYQRTHSVGERLGKIFGFEVIIPNIKKAGTYPLPGGKTITYNEDFEEYPGASLFGKRAWFFSNLQSAEKRFETLTSVPVAEPEDTTEPDPVPESTEPKRRGRPKAERPPLELLVGEFSVKELAEKNKVDYPIAFVFLKEQVAAGAVKLTRTERRAARGPETQLYQKI